MIKIVGGFRRRLLSMVVMAVLPVLLLATAVAVFYVRSKEIEEVNSTVIRNLYKATSEIDRFWERTRSDVLYVASSHNIQEIIRARISGGRDPVTDKTEIQTRQHAARMFRELIETKGNFDQMRYIDKDGMEIVRVNLEEQRGVVVPAEKLQNKKRRYYFTETAALKAGEIYISRVDLNKENGMVEMPYKPVARFATPVMGPDGEFQGIVIINVLMQLTLHYMENLIPGHGLWFLADQEGYYLHNSRDPNKEWGGPADLNTGEGLKKDYPRQFDRIIDGERTEVVINEKNWALFSMVLKLAQNPPRVYVIGHIVPTSLIMSRVYRTGAVLLIASSFALLFSGVLAARSGRKIMRPVLELSKAVNRFREGDMNARANVSSQDEIGGLVVNFNKMANELASQHERMEKELAERTHEIRQSQRAALNLMQDANMERERGERALEQLAASEATLAIRASWAVGLQNVGEKLAASKTVEETARVAVRALSKHLDLNLAQICIPDPEGRPELFESSSDFGNVFFGGVYAEEVFRTKKSIVVENAFENPPHPDFRDEALKRGSGSSATFPIIVDDDCVAALTVHFPESESKSPLMGAVPLLEIFCRQVGYVWGRCVVEEELRNLSRAIEQSPTAVLITDTEGTIQYVNPKFIELTGYTAEEVLGKNPRILNSGETSPELYMEMWETILSGQEWRGEFLNRKKSGELFWEFAYISPVRNAEDVITHFVAVKEDITERKEASVELERAKEAAEAASLAKSDFLASMSHELRTPLNAIIGFSQVLMEPYFGELNDKQAEYVDDILTSGEHLLSLINDILDLSKIEAGGVVLELEEVDVKQLLHDSLVMIKEKAHKHNIALDIKLADELEDLVVIADQRKLKQIIFNLLSNAAKFTPDGGSIVLEAHLLDDKLSVSVTDTGVGIAPEEQEHIFDAFYQVGDSKKDKIPGTGLGLSLVKRFVELHEGDVWVESEGSGKGTRVAFTLPIEQLSEKKETEEEEAESYETEEPKILKILGEMNRLISLPGKGQEAFTICRFYDNEGKLSEKADEIMKVLDYGKRRQDTLEIDEHGSCYLVLEGVDKNSAQDICRRMLEMIKAELGTTGILCSTATFPEDGETSESLLEYIMLKEGVRL